jgi:hypothetical protein
MIERLKSEHRSFESKIVEVQGNINNNDIANALNTKNTTLQVIFILLDGICIILQN